MTIKKYALPALLALAFLAACSGKQPPAAAPEAADDEEQQAPAAVTTPAPEPSKDYPKQAQGMMSLLADAPECQSYRDELQAIIEAPAGAAPAREPALVVAAAHDAKCSKKSRGQ